ncbi:potassium/proton antiporter [Roseibacillus persicicus]|uniref:potassium/proton antiporter n=1 Tax=Roseibacillus persicicus TaxID=454148 RepID=UPI002810346D|nr:potassium/proton antiporter [Roseibacillus persicicus]MDQ8191505.1 potassium/proton antiporter [Roseibacillus persicicus]
MDVVYLIGPIILIAVVLAAVWLDRWSVPVILIALGAGIVFGSDVLNLWHFDDIVLTNKVANLALVFILFYGGISTKKVDFKQVALPAGGLATWGVILTSLVTFGVLYGIFGWGFEKAILLAVIVSSTDAAAIFSILRRQSLPKKLSSTVEIESGANDPMAILLTVAVVQSLTVGHPPIPMMVLNFLWQFGAAPVLGWLMGRAALWLFNHLTPQDRGHFYVLTLGIALLVYGLAQVIGTSGMLAVFIAGFVLGNHSFIHKQGVINFSSAVSTVANIGMFVLLGLQVFPREWAGIWFEGILLFLVLTFLARPLAVLVGTAGMRLGWRNKVFISWAGLRGAVPIVLATYPMAAGIEAGEEIFNLVFFAVLLSVAVQGGSLGPLAGWLKLTVPARPRPLFNLELVTMAASDLDMIVVDLPGPKGVGGAKIAELDLPQGAVITLVTRERELVLPKGSTELRGWDQVSVLAPAIEEEAIREALMGAIPIPAPEEES